MRGNRQKLEHEKFQLAIREYFFHPEVGQTLAQVAQRGLKHLNLNWTKHKVMCFRFALLGAGRWMG